MISRPCNVDFFGSSASFSYILGAYCFMSDCRSICKICTFKSLVVFPCDKPSKQNGIHSQLMTTS